MTLRKKTKGGLPYTVDSNNESVTINSELVDGLHIEPVESVDLIETIDITSVTKLILVGTYVDINFIGDFKNLEELNLNNGECWNLDALTTLNKLKVLSVEDVHLGSFRSLSRINSLEELTLFQSGVEDESEILEIGKNIRKLDLSCVGNLKFNIPSDSDLVYLTQGSFDKPPELNFVSQLTKLKSLTLTEFTDIEYLPNSPGLTSLTLYQNSRLMELPRLPNLKQLTIVSSRELFNLNLDNDLKLEELVLKNIGQIKPLDCDITNLKKLHLLDVIGSDRLCESPLLDKIPDSKILYTTKD